VRSYDVSKAEVVRFALITYSLMGDEEEEITKDEKEIRQWCTKTFNNTFGEEGSRNGDQSEQVG
jgi:hypothetical protein